MKRLLLLVPVIILALFVGCDSSTGSGDGGGGDGDGGGDDPGELGWAYDIAEGVALADDLLIILGGYIDADGGLDDQMGTWTFFFGDIDGSHDQVYQVTVFPDGSHGEQWIDAGDMDPYWIELPEYRDASDWVAAADAMVDGVDFAYRVLMVEPDGIGEYTTADNLCWIAYNSASHVPLAQVVLDADDDEVLDSIIF